MTEQEYEALKIEREQLRNRLPGFYHDGYVKALAELGEFSKKIKEYENSKV